MGQDRRAQHRTAQDRTGHQLDCRWLTVIALAQDSNVRETPSRRFLDRDDGSHAETCKAALCQLTKGGTHGL